MDTDSALLDIDAHVGWRGRQAAERIGTHAQAAVSDAYPIAFGWLFSVLNHSSIDSLLNWIHAKIPDLPINNFTNDWTTGKAVGALVDACAPGLCH